MPEILGNELLRGELVHLTRMTREDIPLIVADRSDIGYLRHLMRSQVMPDGPESIEGWYKWLNEEGERPPSFVIRRLEDDAYVGTTAFKDIRWQSRHAFFWIGIGQSDMRGKGYGTDAVRVLLKYAFLEMNLNCVALEVLAYNAPALASYQKVGFRHDGSVRAFTYRDGAYYDMHLMSMTRDEWWGRYGPKQD